MQKAGPLYIYRKNWIHPYSENGVKGWTVEFDFNIYARLIDAQNAIDQRESGSWWNGQKCPIPKRCSEPITIIGQWQK